MRRAVWILALVARTSAADPLHDFAKKWPKIARDVLPKFAGVGLDASCGPDAPPREDGGPSSVSPDGKTLVVIAPVSLSAAQAKRLAVAETDTTYAFVFDGPNGKLWATPMLWFPSCIPNPTTWEWSKDNRRVFAAMDSGQGDRTMLLDVAARKLIAGGFSNGVELASPTLMHLAMIPHEAGRQINPASGDPAVFGTELFIDGTHVWGSEDPDAAEIWDLDWKSDTRLEFCGKDKLVAAHYVALLGKKLVVSRTNGTCVK